MSNAPVPDMTKEYRKELKKLNADLKILTKDHNKHLQSIEAECLKKQRIAKQTIAEANRQSAKASREATRAEAKAVKAHGPKVQDILNRIALLEQRLGR